jgi:hypothetical protein
LIRSGPSATAVAALHIMCAERHSRQETRNPASARTRPAGP